MKRTPSAKALFLALSLGTAVHAADDKVNVSLLNRLVDKITQESLNAHRAQPNSIFKALELKLDEKGTDLSQEDSIKAKLSFSATAEKTRWHAGESKLSVSLGASADRKQSEGVVEFAASIETDTPALVRYVAREMEAQTCKIAEPAGSYEAKLQQAACDQIKILQTVTEIKPMFKALALLSGYQSMLSAFEASAIQKKIATAKPEEKPYLEKKLASKEQEAAIAMKITQELHRAIIDNSSAKLRASMMKLPYAGELSDLDLYLDKGKFEFSIRYTARNLKAGKMDDYFALRPTIEAELVKLQNNHTATVKNVRGTVSFLLDAAKAILVGQK